ncbi:MAG: ATP-binding protein [Bacteroidota bacterium]|nr:ATP-binding protein [Bacteroidota bacterium]
MIVRTVYSSIKDAMFKGKAIILYGSRQVGKTTITQQLASEFEGEYLLLDCDEPDVRALMENITSTQLKAIIGHKKILFIDEAQRAKNIGITLKLITDKIKTVQVIATGSSALEMASEINEPLTGRKYEYQIHPISIEEMSNHTSWLEESRLLEQRLIYGLYPDITQNQGEAERLLRTLVSSYLYKDLLSLGGIRKPELLQKILQALAFQVGSEVSYNELSRMLGVDKTTISRYIDLLEKTFIIFKLSAFSRNLRSEITTSKKIYFWDNGVRNAVISNFNKVAQRTDIGALWENFMISERLKQNHNHLRYAQHFFWRSTMQQEIDLIEEKNQILNAFEFKWNEKLKARIPATFTKNYQPNETGIISRVNYQPFVS